MFIDRGGVEVHKSQEKNEANLLPVNESYYMAFWKNFIAAKQQVVQRGQDSVILPAQVANHSVEFGSRS